VPVPTDAERLDRLADAALARCDALSAFSEEPGRLTRTFLCDAMHAVHDAVGGWMRETGLDVRVDAAGNIAGRLPGRDGARVLALGSHLDTVPDAGRYDGTLGVLLGLAVAEVVGPGRLPFALDVLGFSEEEGVRFRRPYIGCRAAAGNLDLAEL
jgi:allantoate deiminase